MRRETRGMGAVLRTSAWAAPLVLAAGLLGSGCHMVVLGAAAVVVSQDFIDKAHVHIVDADPALVWAQTKATLAEMAGGPIEVDETAMAASAAINGATVTAHVERFDSKQTRLKVGARKWALYNDEEAERVISRISRALR